MFLPNALPVDPLVCLVLLALLGCISGFFSSYLGIGGGIFIVSLLPLFTIYSPGETIQVSLVLIFSITFVNSLIFVCKRLVAWNWTSSLVAIGGVFAFLSGSLVTELSDFSIRFLLWLFLFFIVVFPFIKGDFFQKQLKLVGGALMGLSSGLAGIGGGTILSPLLHESSSLPLKKISPSISLVTLFMSVFALSGYHWKGGYPLDNFYLPYVFPVLLLFALPGLALGHWFQGKNDRKRRVFIVRVMTAVLFLKVSVELLLFF